MKIVLLLLAVAVAASATPEIPPQVPQIAVGLRNVESIIKPALLLKEIREKYIDTKSELPIDVVNGLVDAVIVEVKKMMVEQGFDPMKLPDIHEGFSFKPIIIEYHGEIDLSRGWLSDASTIYRLNSIALSSESNVYTVKVPLGFRDFMFDYQYSAKLMGLGPSGGIDGKVSDIQFYVDVLLDMNEMNIKLNEFKFLKMGKISFKFNGNILTDWFVNALSGVVTGIFKGLVVTLSEGIIKSILDSIFAIINELLQSGAIGQYLY